MAGRTVHWASTNKLYYTPLPSTGAPTSSPLPNGISVNETLRFKRDLGFTVDLQKDPTREQTLDIERLYESATIPALSFINVVSSKLPFAFHIREPKEGRGITVGDLLYQLHLALRQKVTDGDLGREKPEDMKAIVKAFEKRCEVLKERNVADSVYEKEAGPRRIDYLRGRGTFAGFEIVPNEQPMLRLHVR